MDLLDPYKVFFELAELSWQAGNMDARVDLIQGIANPIRNRVSVDVYGPILDSGTNSM